MSDPLNREPEEVNPELPEPEEGVCETCKGKKYIAYTIKAHTSAGMEVDERTFKVPCECVSWNDSNNRE